MTDDQREAARKRYRREQHQVLRLEFIKAAMQGIAHRVPYGPDNHHIIATQAVQLADATLKAAGEEP